VELGCKGPESNADCWKRGWNNKVNWCIHNSLCLGCTEPGFPDSFSPMYVKTTG
jgi:hydrogenase small subunit